MKKLWSLKVIVTAFTLLFLTAYFGEAAGIWDKGQHTIEAIWNLVKPGKITIGNGADLDIKSGGDLTVKSGGEIIFDSGATLTGTGFVTNTNIADETREWTTLNVTSAYVHDAGPITTATAPNATTIDEMPAILYDNSGETVGVSWTLQVPTDYKTGVNGALVVYALVSTGSRNVKLSRNFSDLKLDWVVYRNRDGVAFDATSYAQDTVSAGAASEMDLSNEVLTLTASQALQNSIAVGDWLTFTFMNASTCSLNNAGYGDDLEIKGLSVHSIFTR
jgi:hypothetical protein